MKKEASKSSPLACHPLYVVSVAMFLVSCATVSLQSVRDPNFSEPLNKFFIILNQGKVDRIDPLYTPFLTAALKDEFSQRGAVIVIRNANALSLDEIDFDSEIASYEPDGVMMIVATGGTVAANTGGLTRITYDVSLYDPVKHKRIWRAHINASGGTAVREKRMKLMAKDLVNRLAEEKLISPEPQLKLKEI